MTLGFGMRVAVGTVALAGSAVCAVGEPEPDAGSMRIGTQVVEGFTTPEGLLDELEASDATLRTYQCLVVYDKRFELQGDQHIRRGRLYFSNEPGADGQRATRKFAVDFDTLTLDGVVRPELQALIFDGEWMVEKREAEKQWIATRVAAPGSQIDPLRLGEGPLPIPFGQSRAAIMARFDVSLLAFDEDFDWEAHNDQLYRDSVRGCWQLRMIPREGTSDADRFREIRLWYTRSASGRLLPRMAFTIDHKGDSSFVQLSGAKVDVPLPEGVIDMREPDASLGWTTQTNDRWAAEAEGAGTDGNE